MEYFKESANPSNFPADICYAQCLAKLNEDFYPHLNEMLKKYEDDINQKQQLLLHIAMLCCKTKNFMEASEKFLQAIQLNHETKRLKVLFLQIK